MEYIYIYSYAHHDCRLIMFDRYLYMTVGNDMFTASRLENSKGNVLDCSCLPQPAGFGKNQFTYH